MCVRDDNRAIVQRLSVTKRLHRFLPQNQKDDWLISHGQRRQKMLLCGPPQIQVD